MASALSSYLTRLICRYCFFDVPGVFVERERAAERGAMVRAGTLRARLKWDQRYKNRTAPCPQK
jgi:hypothetical protein